MVVRVWIFLASIYALILIIFVTKSLAVTLIRDMLINKFNIFQSVRICIMSSNSPVRLIFEFHIFKAVASVIHLV